MYFGFVKQKSVQGDQTTNPFHFDNMNLKKFVLTVNDRKFTEDDMDFEKKLAQKAYFDSVYKSLGATDGNFGISYEDWVDVTTIFCVDTTISENSASTQLISVPQNEGSVQYNLYVEFNAKTSDTVVCFVLAEYSSVFKIDKNGMVV